MAQIINIFDFGGWLPVNKAFARAFGNSLEKSLLLTLILKKHKYFAESEKLDEDEMFFLSTEYVLSEIFIPERSQRRYLDEFVEMGIIRKQNKGMPQRRFIGLGKNAESILAELYEKHKTPNEDAAKMHELCGQIVGINAAKSSELCGQNAGINSAKMQELCGQNAVIYNTQDNNTLKEKKEEEISVLPQATKTLTPTPEKVSELPKQIISATEKNETAQALNQLLRYISAAQLAEKAKQPILGVDADVWTKIHEYIAAQHMGKRNTKNSKANCVLESTYQTLINKLQKHYQKANAATWVEHLQNAIIREWQSPFFANFEDALKNTAKTVTQNPVETTKTATGRVFEWESLPFFDFAALIENSANYEAVRKVIEEKTRVGAFGVGNRHEKVKELWRKQYERVKEYFNIKNDKDGNS